MNPSLKHSTAILIFAQSAHADAKRKKLPFGRELFECLNSDLLQKVQCTGQHYFVYNERLQIGADFGARLTAAMQGVFSKGYGSLIVLGNDTPNLTLERIVETLNQVRQGKTVIGPSTDGGIYILGVHQCRFDALSFRQLPWQKATLYQETARYFLRKGTIHQLPRLTDIDGIDDIDLVLDHRNALSLRLLRLLLKMRKSEDSPKIEYSI